MTDAAREVERAGSPSDGHDGTTDGSAGTGETTTGREGERLDRLRPPMVAAIALVPWTVVVYPRGIDLVFPWGLVNTNPLAVIDLYSYLFAFTGGYASLPARLTAWPQSTVLFALALASACLAVVDREDPRVTAAFLALAGLVHLQVALGLLRLGETALPVGPAVLFGAAWWVFGRR